MEYNLLLQEAFEFCCHFLAKLYNNRNTRKKKSNNILHLEPCPRDYQINNP